MTREAVASRRPLAAERSEAMDRERPRGGWTEERAQRGTSEHVTREAVASRRPLAAERSEAMNTGASK